MDRNISGSLASSCLASHCPGVTLLSAAIVVISFDLDLRYSKGSRDGRRLFTTPRL
ncbi:hypothetical protein HNP84_010391 [Thermocatellispora tengchongensis]|uniref:Uncharacterized protein n=1 Tax=Thermocatellispora tengchongensis TaxID=1073253 RepID=A0A840PMA5_9ACTN|nr:hypothetical protein [Thermocatellispora tengchongensis]MBB5140618.1 hypothetical protein [Thermocatellispora tengchongensis]